MNLKALKTIMTSMGAELPSRCNPTNIVAEFIDNEIQILMPADPAVVDIFQGVYVGIANKNPNKVLETLVRIHNDIGNLVKDIQTAELIDNDPPEEIENEDEIDKDE